MDSNDYKLGMNLNCLFLEPCKAAGWLKFELWNLTREGSRRRLLEAALQSLRRRQEATASVAAAVEISQDAVVVALLSERGGIFTIKQEQRRPAKAFSGERCYFFPLNWFSAKSLVTKVTAMGRDLLLHSNTNRKLLPGSADWGTVLYSNFLLALYLMADF